MTHLIIIFTEYSQKEIHFYTIPWGIPEFKSRNWASVSNEVASVGCGSVEKTRIWLSCIQNMVHVMRKCVFEHMRTVKSQNSLRIRVVCWGPPLFTERKLLDTTLCINGEQMSGWYFVHAQDDLNLRIFRMFAGLFSLKVAYTHKYCQYLAGQLNT